MASKNPAIMKWDDKRKRLEQDLDTDFSGLEREYENARDDFKARLKQNPPKSFRRDLEASLKGLERNMKMMRSLVKGCYAITNKKDSELVKKIKTWEKMFPEEELDEGRERMEMRQVDFIEEEVSNMVSDARVLCQSLRILLKQNAPNAIEKGAVGAFLDSLSQLGSGVFSVMQNLRNVVTRNPTKDQTTGDTLRALEEFEEVLDKWVSMVQEMGNGLSYHQAYREAFAKRS